MQTFHSETTVEKDGKLLLEHLPFPEGEPVHVFVSSTKSVASNFLRGAVLKYDQPFSPVPDGDWESSK